MFHLHVFTLVVSIAKCGFCQIISLHLKVYGGYIVLIVIMGNGKSKAQKKIAIRTLWIYFKSTKKLPGVYTQTNFP